MKLVGRARACHQAVMSCDTPSIEIIEIDRVEIAVEPWSWEFARARREDIDQYFARRQRERPTLWNGRVLLLKSYQVTDGLLRGSCFETDYASFLAWRDGDFPDAAGILNIFASAALRSADGAYLVGEMAPGTASAGAVYFPCGTPDLDDVGADGTLDLDGSLSRELLEETGLDIGTLKAEPGWTLVRDRGFLSLMKRLTANESAEQLRSRIMRYLASEALPEFCDIRIVRGRTDIEERMPGFLVAFLTDVWRQ